MPVGRVGRPHGVDGSFVVEEASDADERFALGAEIWAGGEPARVVAAKRVGGGRLAVRLNRPVGRGTELAVPRETLPEPGEDAFYVFELVGRRVEEEGGRELGRVRDVLSYPANDVLELDSGLLLPMVDACVLAVEPERIVVARGFAEPAD